MPLHPLEPLSAVEVEEAVFLLNTLDSFTSSTRIISIMLHEPPKGLVYAWPGGGVVPDREAEAVLFDNKQNRGSHALVNLSTGTATVVKQMPAGVQPTMSIDEMAECEAAVIASPEFRAALERHYGVSDTSLVMVDIWSSGNYGSDEDRTRRIARPLCFLRSEPGENGYARPIEGIRPVVDINSMEVIRVEEYGQWPLPPLPADYAASRVAKFRDDIKRLLITQPDGPSFKLNGHHIAWQNWEFLIGFNAREGLTIQDVRYVDQGRVRPILYRGSLTEMVVPYGDPRPTQARKNAFDVGEYGMGMGANSLRLGCDCLGHIEYLDADLCDSRGGPLKIEQAICIHEEDYGILWKHTDRRLPDAPEVRRSRRLVVSSVSTVENYEYGFFWYFYQDGNIGFEVKLTGILSLGAAREGEKLIHGSMVAPLLYAPNHQHFFNMRLDVGVDGQNNTVQQLDVVADPLDEHNPYCNAFHVEARPLATESEACANLSLETGRAWKFVNPAVTNALGEPVGYKFLAGDNAIPFASKQAWWRKRAGFVDHHVWVTPFDPDERYAAGDYPNQSSGGDGLPAWIAADRPIENTDVVFWYTFGHTHIPRPEDCPVMPTAYIGFLLKPNGFFDMNPSNDVPPSAPVKAGSACKHC
jgi:primary-amine oxidase